MAFYLIGLGKALFILLIALVFLPLLIYLERKGSSFIQDRTGPNRAAIGPIRLAGFIHVLADVVKLLTKETMIPQHVNRWYFTLAPFIGFTVICLGLAAIPWADVLVIGDWSIPMTVSTLNGGVLFILAITSLHVYGIVLAGWSSNNKYALLGGLRSTAQMISYEIPLALSLIGLFMVFQTVRLDEIVVGQGKLLFGFLPAWGVFVQPLGFLLFLVSAFAEANRTPFDTPESEQELVAGYHTEYAGIRFALFYMAEYAAIILASAMIATLFFGGWQVPYVSTAALQSNAALVLRILLGLGAFLSLVGVIEMSRYQKRLGAWGDARDKEGAVLAGGAFIGLVAHIAALVYFWNMTLPAWGESTVAFVAQVSVFIVKWLFFCWFFIWARWSLPRFRYDQTMRLGWKGLIPLSFLNIFLTGLVILLLER